MSTADERTPPTMEELLPLLPHTIRRVLDSDDDQIFETDFDYFNAIDAMVAAKFMIGDMRNLFVISF